MDSKRDSNYHIISHIGQGAYGQVYKARKKQTGQTVAIKTMKKKGKTQKDINNMRQEIEILKKLKHENIVLLLDAFETSSEFVMVTELGRGELFNIIEDDQYLSETEIRKIAQQLVRALHYLHSNRITHRDMKPQNILICDNGVVKLCDFGFARHMSYNTQVLTSIKGTPLYMAPEMVKELPYTHTADLWSLGVILFELATGSPPFTASNLLGLVEHIVNDTIKYPETLSSEFKGFLKGLLNKNPSDRLGWPQLLNHPFVRQTEAQKVQRKKRLEKYNHWLVQNQQANENSSMSVNTSVVNPKSSNASFQEKRDLSSKKVACQDDSWAKYQVTASEQKGASSLRSDSTFLNKLLSLLSTNINEVLRTKERKGIIQCGLKVLTLVMIKGKAVDKKIDIVKDSNIPNHLLNLLKSILKIEGGKNHIQFIGDLVKTIGLLSKSTFDKNAGIEMVYLRSLIPLLPQISKAALLSDEPPHHSLITSLVKCVGIFANNASANQIRSFSFYKDIVDVKFAQDCITFVQHLEVTNPTIKYIVQVFSALMHPFCGDITTFPWKRNCSSIVAEFNQYSTMFECVRQNIMNCLSEIDWVSLFTKVFQLEQQGNHIVKVSILRIILQSIRQSKEYTEKIINDKHVLKLVFGSLSVNESIIQSTGCMVISLLLKHTFKEKCKEPVMESFTSKHMPQIVEFFDKSKYNSIPGICSLYILQEALTNDLLSQLFAHKFESLVQLRILGELLANPNVNKIQEMRLLEGSNYGCHVSGFYDSVIGFLHRFMMRYNKDHGRITQLCHLIEESKLDDKLIQLLITLSSKTDLSPKGLITLLMLCHDLMIEWKPFSCKLLEDNCLKSLIGLLKESQLLSIQEWPSNSFGGGTTCIQLLSGNLMKIFINALQQPEKQAERICKIFANTQIVKLTVNYTKYLTKQTVTPAVTFLCRLSLYDDRSRQFIRQTIEESGLELYAKFDLLGPKSTTPLVLEALSLVSQMARISDEYYPTIHQMNLYPQLRSLISHSDPVIRSRVLNLLGNMCRHTKFFYPVLEREDLIHQCMARCQDQDKLVRKFACVVIGNAGFYDDSLYQTLKPSIGLLVALLRDSQQKTRSNAAAALGNLARNSSLLDQEFIRTRAVYQLISLLASDKSPTTKRIVLVSVNNLLSLQESCKLLLQLDIKKVVNQVMLQNSGDAGIVKNATKIMDKLA